MSTALEQTLGLSPSAAGTSEGLGTPPAIATHELTQRFGDIAAVDAVTLEVPVGQIFGIVGPSGSGKTSLVRLLVGLALPDSGTALVLGRAPTDQSSEARSSIGYAPQQSYLDPALTVSQNASFIAKLYGLGWRHRRRRIQALLELLDLEEARDRRVQRISGGMQRRLLLVCALLHRPTLLIVDEPSSGLDPLLRVKIWDHLRELRDLGTSVLVTTQHLDEADYCDRLGILHHGRLIATGSPEELRREARNFDTLDLLVPGVDRTDIASLWELPRVRQVSRLDDTLLRVQVDDADEVAPSLTEQLVLRGRTVESVHPHRRTFDEVFADLVARADE